MVSPTALQWLSLIGVLWLQSINGTNMNFPAFSSHLKSLLGLSQLQLNNLAFASDAGKLAGFVSGMAALYLPLWLVLLLGSTLGLVGYGLQYLFLAHGAPTLSYLHIFSLTVLAGNSICWINTVSYIVVIRNFPTNRQVAVGLTTSYLGLSAKIYTVIVDAVFPPSRNRDNAYLLLNAVVPLAVCLCAAPIVRGFESSAKFASKRSTEVCFISMFAITMVTGIYAVVSSLLSMPSVINAAGIALLLVVPLLVPLGGKIREVILATKRIKKELRVYDEESTVESGVSSNKGQEEEGFDCDEVCDSLAAKEEIGAKEMVQRLDFWLYFFVYLFGATLGLVFLNNLGQIAESRGCTATSSLVALSSSFGFFGRLVPSFMDYFFSRTRSMASRPAQIVAWMVPMAGSFFLLLSAADTSLYISTATIGVCTGAITSLAVSLTSELFGTMNFGVNHNVVVANIPIGSLVFGYQAAYLYHKEGGSTGMEGKCMGMDCYRTTFVVWGSLCSLGTVMALALHTRTRAYYSQGKSSDNPQT